MTLQADDSVFPSLFAHSLRKEWGVGVRSGEKDGKHSYLFENGEERTLAAGFHDLMRRVEAPNAEQQVALARLQGMLAGRARDSDAAKGKPLGWSLANQLAKFRESYPAGVSDPDWIELVRGSGRGHRRATMQEAQEKFDAKTLDARLSAGQHVEVWESVAALLARSELVPPPQLKLKAVGPAPMRELSLALREQLHGVGPYDKRMDRFLSAFLATFGASAGWELATALPALVHPLEHVCVEAAVFKKQLKASLAKRPVAAKPTGVGYNMCLSVSRLVANKLAEQGEIPRDLWDVRDFMVFTLRPTPKARVTKKTAPPPAPADDDE